MDAVKFIEERNRMCMSFSSGCNGCPAFNELCCAVGNTTTMGAKDQVDLVEKWSIDHPCKTRQSVFLEQWPDAVLDEYGILMFCPRYISIAYRDGDGKCKNPAKKCIDCCHEFWTQEV